MKKHTYKKSTVVLYIYYLLNEGKELTIRDLSYDLNISVSTLYLYINDIDLFLAEFHLTHIELIKNNSKIKLKKNRKDILITTSIFKFNFLFFRKIICYNCYVFLSYLI